MRYIKFLIRNYKGIKSLELDLDLFPDHKIYTLVGLNESGKTTILEAINDFEFDVSVNKRHLLIPKSSAGGFTGDIAIKATLQFSEDDKGRIIAFIRSRIKVSEVFVSETLIIERKYSFKNSTPYESKRTYEKYVKIKKTAKGKPVDLDESISKELWSFIKETMFPEIIFYRDFLSKFPEKIYLDAEDPKDKNYLSIIEDILTAINPDYNVQNSLLDRLDDSTDAAKKQALEAVENDMGAKISKVVFDAWNKILNVSKKEIVVKAEYDAEKGRYYLRLSVKDGHQTYAVAERSLGFRWFFTFLLYTEFRKERIKTSGEILFILDEPASNLHQTAQQSLLETFRTITSKSRLIYTTHSHHLVNPEWLSSAYIIRNKGLKYNESDDYNLTKTEIEAFKYKQFVSKYPTETSYFQPILDVLDYKPGLLELIPNIVITEGKFDYFTFRYFKEIVFSDLTDGYRFYPGMGASSLDLPISLYESWGKGYLVLLDSDKEGRDQKERYIKDISDTQHIYTLEDCFSDLKNSTTEKVFTETEKIEISKEFNSELTEYNKNAFNTGIQILLMQKRIPDYLTDETKKKMRKIIEFINGKI
ncbi:MAG: AAA family ATPase [Candidatus Moranbacteria bacterium]|nr:AAA family ATPase [Candidatus Moranbacteria bacterium]